MSGPHLRDDSNSAWLTTLASDGSPHTTPVWFVMQADRCWIASAAKNRKVRNLQRDPRVSVALDGSTSCPQVALGRATIHSCEIFPEIVAEFAAKYYGWDAADPAPDGPRVLVRVLIDRWLLGGPEV